MAWLRHLYLAFFKDVLHHHATIYAFQPTKEVTTFQAYTTFSSSFFSTMDKRHHRIFLSVPNVSKRRRFEFFSGAFFFFALLVVCSLSSVFSIFISYVRESYPFLFFYILSNHKKCFISHFRFTFFFFFFFPHLT